MVLRGIKVLEFGGLAPAPFCGMVLADFGASVIRIDRIGVEIETDVLGNGKMSLAVNIHHPEGVNIIKKLSKKSDVLIEPFRDGVMESLGLGTNVLLKENPQLVYARLTGYGNAGIYRRRAGHDINYLSMTGLLSMLGRAGENPVPPANFAADFAGGGLMCAFGIVLALVERQSSNLGQIVDSTMVEGTAYLGSWMYRSQDLLCWGQPKGHNLFDLGTHFYETFKTKDGKFMAVGSVEQQFYQTLLKGLGLNDNEVIQLGGDFNEFKKLVGGKFLEKTQEEWCKIFDGCDSCVTPVLSLEEAPLHPQNVARNSFVVSNGSGQLVPNVAPKLSRTPGSSQAINPSPNRGQHTSAILQSLGYSSAEILKLENMNVVEIYRELQSSKL